MVNSPLFYSAILTLWLVALPGLKNISHVLRNVNDLPLVVSAAPSFLILRSVEAIVKAQWP